MRSGVLRRSSAAFNRRGRQRAASRPSRSSAVGSSSRWTRGRRRPATRPSVCFAGCTAITGPIFRRRSGSRPTRRRCSGHIQLHPEILRRFSGDWSVLEKFQRTRGILKIMANAVYALWSGESRAPLITPAMLPFRDVKVRTRAPGASAQRIRADPAIGGRRRSVAYGPHRSTASPFPKGTGSNTRCTRGVLRHRPSRGCSSRRHDGQ